MKNLVLLTAVLFAFAVTGCDRMEEKRTADQQHGTETPGNKPNKMEKPNDDVHNPGGTGSASDDKTGELTKTADESFEKYNSDKSEANKKEAITKSLEAGMYLMYDAELPPKDKYGPALKYFRRVLALDPANGKAKENKDKIEEIYEMMGKPIPQS